MRPNDNREAWREGDTDLTAGHPCWALEWAEEGWETVVGAEGVQWPRIPVTVQYDEGVVIVPIADGEATP